jgi:hypothetical protein
VRRRGALPWRYAAMPRSATLRHMTIAPDRSARSSDDDMAWRGQVWRVATPSWIKTRRFRCRADVNRVMILLRLSVGRCAFPARLLRPLCWRCEGHADPGPGRAIRTGLVGDHQARRAGWLADELAPELLRRAPALAALDQGAGNRAISIDGANRRWCTDSHSRVWVAALQQFRVRHAVQVP